MKKHYLFTFLMSVLLGTSLYAQTVITQWDFESGTLDPNIGSGTATLIGGTNTHSISGVWRTDEYPDQEEDSGTAGVEFAISTVGFEDITFSYRHQSSGTASRYAQIEYSTNGGGTWNVAGTNQGGVSPHGEFYDFDFDLTSCTACNENPDFKIRIVSIFAPCDFVQNETLTYAANTAYMRSNDDAQCEPHTTTNSGDYSGDGNWRFDDVTVSGVALIPNITVTPTSLATFTQANGEPSDASSILVEGSNLEEHISLVAPTGFEISLNETEDFETSLVLTQTDGTVEETEVFVRLNSETAGNFEGDLIISSLNASTIEIELQGSTIGEPDDLIMYYWHFNDAGDQLVEVDGDDQFVAPLQADFAVAGLIAEMDYIGTGGRWDLRTNRAQDPVSNLNLQQGESPNDGAVLRLRNPSDERELIITAPTSGYEDIVVRFATVRSGSGAQEQLFYYSTDEGETWEQIGDEYSINELNTIGDWELKTFDLTTIDALEDNHEVMFKIAFTGMNADASSGNNRIDNFSISGSPLLPTITVTPTELASFTQTIGSPSDAVSITVQGANLTDDILIEAPTNFEISLNESEDYETSLTLTQTGGIVSGTEVFVRLNAETLGASNGDLSISSEDVTTIEIELEGTTIEESDETLIYYWHFNDAGDQLVEVDGDDQFVAPLQADFTASGLAGEMDYVGTGGRWDLRTYRAEDPVSNLNLQQGQLPDEGAVLRLRNPSEEKELIITAPTSGYEDIIVRFATVRTGNGAQEQAFYYSTDEGETWDQVGDDYEVNELNVLADWELKEFDLTEIEGLEDNEEVMFKISFLGDNADGGSGNNRIDNFSISGKLIEPITDPTITVTPQSLASFNQTLGTPSEVQSFTVQGVNLTEAITINAPADFEISLEEEEDFSASIELEEEEGVVEETTIYVRMNKSEEGQAQGEIEISSEDATTVVIELEGTCEEEVVPAEAELIYYWHFNTLETPEEDVKSISADFSLQPDFTPTMTYTGESNRDIDEYNNGSAINLQLEENVGKAARVRNRSEGRSLIFDVSTESVEDVVFEYAVYRSGSGMLKNIVEYSIDGGTTFTQEGLDLTEFDIEETYKLIAIDFEGIETVNDNPDFQIRITWEGNTDQENGNNRYDNITLKGVTMDDLSVKEYQVVNVALYPNPTQGILTIETSSEMETVAVIDLNGRTVHYEANINGTHHQLSTSEWNSGVYIVKLFGNGTVSQHKVVKQ